MTNQLIAQPPASPPVINSLFTGLDELAILWSGRDGTVSEFHSTISPRVYWLFSQWLNSMNFEDQDEIGIFGKWEEKVDWAETAQKSEERIGKSREGRI